MLSAKFSLFHTHLLNLYGISVVIFANRRSNKSHKSGEKASELARGQALQTRPPTGFRHGCLGKWEVRVRCRQTQKVTGISIKRRLRNKNKRNNGNSSDLFKSENRTARKEKATKKAKDTDIHIWRVCGWKVSWILLKYIHHICIQSTLN